MSDSRISFVTHEYRTLELPNNDILAKFPDNARIVSLDTNLDLAGATIRAAEELASGAAPRAMEVTVEHIFLPEDWKDGPPTFAIYSNRDNLFGQVFKAFDAQIDLMRGTTTLKMRQWEDVN